MLLKPSVQISLPSFFTKQKFIVTLNNRVLTDLKIDSQHSIYDTTFVSLFVEFDYTKTVTYETTKEITSELYVQKNLNIYISPYMGQSYNVLSYRYEISELEDGSKELVVYLELEEGPTTYAEDIDYIDPILMFYRKILPYDKYVVYAVFKDSLAKLGKIEKITYDTITEEYKVYSESGVSINYKDVPLVNPTKVNIQGTQYTNPPTAIWILDEYDIDDLIWLNQIEIHKIDIDQNIFNTFSDWIFNLDQQNIVINSITIEVRSINKRIHFNLKDFPYLKADELIYSFSTDIISTIPFPFRELFLKVDKQYTLTTVTINYSDTGNTYNSDVILTGYFISDSKN